MKYLSARRATRCTSQTCTPLTLSSHRHYSLLPAFLFLFGLSTLLADMRLLGSSQLGPLLFGCQAKPLTLGPPVWTPVFDPPSQSNTAARRNNTTAGELMRTAEGRQALPESSIDTTHGNMVATVVEEWNHVCNKTNAPANYFIYCTGRILEAVNYHRLYEDSKDFVDSPLVHSPKETQAAFEQRFGTTPTAKIDRTELVKFVAEHFNPPGSELMNCTPADWRPHPTKLMAIRHPQLRKWALELNALWPDFCRQMRPEIANATERYSLTLYSPYEFIVPGGRFREFYYWDAYWIVRGLMASEMYDTAAQMIRNLARMVDTYGFVPNGGRIYYLSRSQPPLLAAMVYEYYVNSGNLTFLREMLPTLDAEMLFWDRHRSITLNHPVSGEQLHAFRYHADSNVPRPESYKEDMTTSAGMNSVAEQQFFYRSMASAAESGWDFSTRWFRNGLDLSSIETVNVVPVDLNSYMCWNFKILCNLWRIAGNSTQSVYYRIRYGAIQDMLEKLFFNSTMGAWYDFNMRVNGTRDTNFYPSVALPLFANCYDGLDVQKPEGLYALLNASGVFSYPGGIPSSMIPDSGEQWDFPNGWAPHNHMMIEGLRKSENPYAQEQGFQLARKWVNGNHRVYLETRKMWEKYNVIGSQPSAGTGGEYVVQDGFGWSNGVILDLLASYYDRLDWEDPLGGDGSGEGGEAAQKGNGALRLDGAASQLHYIASAICLLLAMLVWG